MFAASSDDRGTVQSLAKELDEVCEDGRELSFCYAYVITKIYADGIRLELSTRSEERDLPSDIYLPLLTHLQLRLPTNTLYSYLSLNLPAGGVMLSPRATLFDHVIANGMCYRPLSCSTSAENSLVAVRMNSSPTSTPEIGELLSILAVDQADIGGCRLFGHMRWLKPSNVNITGTFWSTLYVGETYWLCTY